MPNLDPIPVGDPVSYAEYTALGGAAISEELWPTYLARAVRVAGKVEPVFVERVAQMKDAVLAAVRDGDVVVTMGAGSVGGLAPELARAAARADVRELRGRGA